MQSMHTAYIPSSSFREKSYAYLASTPRTHRRDSTSPVASQWDRDVQDLPEGTPHPSTDPDAAVEAFFAFLRTAYVLTTVTVQN